MSGCVVLPVDQTRQQCVDGQPETTPSNRFRIDEVSGTVLDTHTRLTWKRCAEGQIYTRGRCEGRATPSPWDTVMAKFGLGRTEWRLPTADELLSIVEMRCNFPSINLAVFPDKSSDWFWTETPFPKKPDSVWYVNLYKSGAGAKDKNNYLGVRLVRGERWIDSSGIVEKYRKEIEEKEVKELEDANQKVLKQRQAEDDNRRREEEESRRKAEDIRLKSEEARKKEEASLRRIAEIQKAKNDAFFECSDKLACDKVFSLTQIYLNQTSDMKIQLATDTIVETYNPEEGKLGLKAIRIPSRGTSARVLITATCKEESSYSIERCYLSQMRAYQGFRPFVEKMLRN